MVTPHAACSRYALGHNSMVLVASQHLRAVPVYIISIMEPDVHYRLIKQIERFPALYNYNLPDYANKLVCDKLWEQVARKTNSTVGECKEKWRNIRSSFIRSRKAPVNGSRPKKTYYLAEHLSFILPYIKARDINIIPFEDDKEQENMEDGDTQSQDCNFDINKSEEDDFDTTIKDDNEIFLNEPYPMSLSSVRSRKRRLSEDETSDYVKRKDNRKAEKQKHPMHYFFLSLSDEFDTMDERQLRQFKIKVLQALDEIKSNVPIGISSPVCSTVTSQNIVAYSTKNLRENAHNHLVGAHASSAKSREPKDKDIVQVNIQNVELDGDSVIKLENDIAFD